MYCPPPTGYDPGRSAQSGRERAVEPAGLAAKPAARVGAGPYARFGGSPGGLFPVTKSRCAGFWLPFKSLLFHPTTSGYTLSIWF